MNVLIACEYSGIIRECFKKLGHNAVSCDLLPTEIEGIHYQGYVEDIIDNKWDLMIAHPPCTYLSYAGNRWLNKPYRDIHIQAALEFFNFLLNAPIPRICIENPRGWANKNISEPDQIIHPYQFNEPFQKATCLWLNGLPLLKPTNILDDYQHNWTKYKKGSHTSKSRSRTFIGVAKAMAIQWG